MTTSNSSGTSGPSPIDILFPMTFFTILGALLFGITGASVGVVLGAAIGAIVGGSETKELSEQS